VLAGPERLPLPEIAPGSLREQDAELPGKEDELPAVMALVCHEIRQDMPDIQGEVAPHVGRRRGDPTTMGTPQAEEILDGSSTLAKGPDKVSFLDNPPVYRHGDTNTVWLAKSSNPHAPRIVDMAGDHPGSAAGCPRDRQVPDRGRETGKKQMSDASVGLPGREDDLFETR